MLQTTAFRVVNVIVFQTKGAAKDESMGSMCKLMKALERKKKQNKLGYTLRPIGCEWGVGSSFKVFGQV